MLEYIVHVIGMSYVFSWVIGYAKLIAGIDIDIGATEAASEAVESMGGHRIFFRRSKPAREACQNFARKFF